MQAYPNRSVNTKMFKMFERCLKNVWQTSLKHFQVERWPPHGMPSPPTLGIIVLVLHMLQWPITLASLAQEETWMICLFFIDYLQFLSTLPVANAGIIVMSSWRSTLSSYYMKVNSGEMAFSLLTNKFCILKGCVVGLLDHITAIVMTCAWLHNFVIWMDGINEQWDATRCGKRQQLQKM